MKTRNRILRWLAACALCAACGAQAKGIEKTVDYSVGDQPYRGYIYYDSAGPKKRPVVLMVPNWMGTSEANRRQARQIAGRDYVVFLADMYGRDQQPANPDAAGKLVGQLYGNRLLLRTRVKAAKEQAQAAVKRLKLPANAERIAAIGFCFGGSTVLELARTGEELDAVVSFHGNPSLDAPAPSQPPKTRILVLHGDSDPYVPVAQINAFLDEMRTAKADWQMVRFGGAVHSFTDPDANQPGKAMYDAKSARRAFAMMRDFLADSFAGR
ncbi:dienelactone hydrolase family protein [Solimonas sp. K1W22B-7]|uniref:dienelactone hydrolase family protein n=1 Tax=Solimonas sp. K1W22B-7 TaxID=2303331 RepID=UPI000E32D4E3|nr:dienelactone hydrolase family protein [Solimonas sp. K1W22B-7]AXQ27702.1 dienelactone hydrolase family protein [Solimonas sp. K1W22B-7]